MIYLILGLVWVLYGIVTIGCLASIDDFDEGFAAVVQGVLTLIFWPIILPWRLLVNYGEEADARRTALGELADCQRRYEMFSRQQKRDSKAGIARIEEYEDTLAAIEPYINWREITDDLEGKFCETWADALDESHKRADRADNVPEGKGYSPTDRWWREGLMDTEEK